MSAAASSTLKKTTSTLVCFVCGEVFENTPLNAVAFANHIKNKHHVKTDAEEIITKRRNVRERRRTYKIRKAYEKLNSVIPNPPKQVSRAQTVKRAMDYIKLLTEEIGKPLEEAVEEPLEMSTNYVKNQKNGDQTDMERIRTKPRNVRKRRRDYEIRKAYEKLQSVIPDTPKRVSCVQVVNRAINYIEQLQKEINKPLKEPVEEPVDEDIINTSAVDNLLDIDLEEDIINRLAVDNFLDTFLDF